MLEQLYCLNRNILVRVPVSAYFFYLNIFILKNTQLKLCSNTSIISFYFQKLTFLGRSCMVNCFRDLADFIQHDVIMTRKQDFDLFLALKTGSYKGCQ